MALELFKQFVCRDLDYKEASIEELDAWLSDLGTLPAPNLSPDQRQLAKNLQEWLKDVMLKKLLNGLDKDVPRISAPITMFMVECGRFGILNLGNQCYSNSVMQMLYSIPPIRMMVLDSPNPYLPEKVGETSSFITRKDIGEGMKIAFEVIAGKKRFMRLVKAPEPREYFYWTVDEKKTRFNPDNYFAVHQRPSPNDTSLEYVIKPNTGFAEDREDPTYPITVFEFVQGRWQKTHIILQSIKYTTKCYGGVGEWIEGRQQDAPEMLQSLFARTTIEMLDNTTTPFLGQTIFKRKLEPGNTTSFNSILMLGLANSVQEALNIDQRWQVKEALKQEGKRVYAQRALFTSLPSYLIISLKRFDIQLRRIGRDIVVEDTVVVAKVKYELRGYIVHEGATRSSGHYVYVCKNMDGKWRLFNDHNVTDDYKVNDSRKRYRKKQAFVCLYEAIGEVENNPDIYADFKVGEKPDVSSVCPIDPQPDQPDPEPRVRRSQRPFRTLHTNMCGLNPKRACSSAARSHNAYTRRELVQIAKRCGLKNVRGLSITVLCRLIANHTRTRTLEDYFLQQGFQDQKDFLPILKTQIVEQKGVRWDLFQSYLVLDSVSKILPVPRQWVYMRIVNNDFYLRDEHLCEVQRNNTVKGYIKQALDLIEPLKKDNFADDTVYLQVQYRYLTYATLLERSAVVEERLGDPTLKNHYGYYQFVQDREDLKRLCGIHESASPP